MALSSKEKNTLSKWPMTGYEKIFGEKGSLHDDEKKIRIHDIPDFQGPCPTTIEQYQDVLKQSLVMEACRYKEREDSRSNDRGNDGGGSGSGSGE